MSKRSVLVLILAAILLTAFSVALSRRDSRDWRANRSRRLLPFPWQDTTAVTIARPGHEPLRFEKSAKGVWQILLPDNLADTLSNRAVDDMAALATLTWREPIRDARPPAPAAATVLTATSSGGQQVELAFGDVGNNLRTTMIDGDDTTLYGVNQDLLKFLDWPELRFRNFYLASAGSGRKPKRVVLSPRAPGQSLRVAIERGQNGWKLVEPVAWPADESRLDLLFRWLERLRAESIAAEMSGDLQWFGFDADAAFVEIEYDVPGGGTVKRRVEFGKDTDDGKVYARVADRQPIFILPKETLSEISIDVAADYPQPWKNFFRRRALTALGEEMPSAITIERLLPSPVKLTLEQIKGREGVKWQGKLESARSVRTFAVEPPDGAEPMRPLTALVTGLSSLRVKTFLADIPPGPDTVKWTAYPVWRFSSQNVDGSVNPALTLYAADAEGDLPPGDPFVEGKSGPQEMRPKPGLPDKVGMSFSLEDRPAIMETFADLAYLLCLPPYRYQSRRLIDSDPRDLTRITVATPKATIEYIRKSDEVNEQWWRGSDRPEPLMDDNNLFVGLALELSQLRTEGFVADADKEIDDFGLDQPEITAIVYSSKGGTTQAKEGETRFKLSIGAAADASGKTRYARLNDAGPVFLVPERLAETLGREYR